MSRLAVDQPEGLEPSDAPGSQEETDPLVGSVLADTYRVDRVLADGGMGRLYEAFQLRLELPVAIKVVHAFRGIRDAAKKRAEREAISMAAIRSHHVVRVLDLLWTPDGRPCMVTELLDGEDLAVRLERDGHLPVSDAVSIARQMCLGMMAAHAQGLIHRDLKPSNVFLAREGEEIVVKLIDFGVAKFEHSEQLTHAGAFVGTPAYMAPEQAMASNVDERADVYALGAILYHLLSGQPPYGRLDATQTLMRLLKEEPPRLGSITSAIPEELAAVVESAMAREPTARTQTAAALLESLRPFAVSGGENDARSSGEPAPSARWLRPRAIGYGLLAAVVFAAWSAALTSSLVFGAFRPAEWPHWATLTARIVPSALGLVLFAALVRAQLAAWRSAPRIARHVRAVTTGLAVGLITHALGVLGVAATHWFLLDPAPLFPFEHLAALLVAALAAVTGGIYRLRK